MDAFVTVTVAVALIFILTVLVAVIVAVPAAFAVTTPFDTVAMLEFEVDQETVLLALAGVAVTVNDLLEPTDRLKEVELRVKPVSSGVVSPPGLGVTEPLPQIASA